MAYGAVVVEVDVLIPVRAPAPWLPQTLAGVTAMTGPTRQVIIALHGSSLEVEEAVTRSGLPATIVPVPQSATLAAVLNAGLAAGTAPYVARLDADDIPLPHRLEVQVHALNGDPDCAVVCSSKLLIDASGGRIGLRRAPATADALLGGMRWKNVIWHPTVMMRRAVVEKLGGYNAAAVHAEDYDLWLRVLQHWRIEPIVEPLIEYRLHASQVTAAKAIPRESAAIIGTSRLSLARARGESLVAARIRQAVWSGRQVTRRLLRTD